MYNINSVQSHPEELVQSERGAAEHETDHEQT